MDSYTPDIFGVAPDEASKWRERFAQVRPAVEQSDLKALEGLAKDPEWEVRRAVADEVNDLPDDMYVQLIGLLLTDENIDVRRSAERARSRRRLGSAAPAAAESDPEALYARLEKKLGATGSHLMPHVRDLCTRQINLLVAPIVHDVRNLLNIASAQLESIECSEEKIPADLHSSVESLREAHDRALRLVEALLDYSKSLKLNLREHQLVRLADAAVDPIRPLFPYVQFQIDIAPQIMVSADSDAIHRALTNLLKNSAEVLQQMPDPLVAMTAFVTDRVATIQIRDNGPGLPPEILARIITFVPGVRSAKPDSNGFGIANANRIVRAHGGSMRIASPESGGALVEIRIPALS